MNRVCLTKDGKLIEMQSGGDDNPELMDMRLNTLKQNALNGGYKEDEIDVKWVSDDEWVAIQEANKPVPPYQQLRAMEYPPMADYLDAIVKDDQVQMQKYIDDCLAVKKKYPKG